MEREDVAFFSGGERCAAWFYRPEGEGPHPCVVLATGFGATRAGRLWAYAERFAAAGMSALVFDYRHLGDSAGEPRQLVDFGRQLEDWRAAIVFARALETVDPSRIGLWGTSLGGGHVVRVAAGDASVAAVVSQLPYTTAFSALREAGAIAVGRLMIAAVRDSARALRSQEPYRMPVVAEPGRLAAIARPGAVRGFMSLYEDEEGAFRNEVAARVVLRVPAYNPGWWARRVRCPLLVCVAEHDVVTPPGPAEAMAARAPHGELVEYPISHFDIYVGEWFERAVADQTDFLSRSLMDTDRRASLS